MHKVFGIKENCEYFDREGAYLIVYQNGKIGVVKTPKGYFFIGGGIENNESHFDCIKRECIEEVGYSCIIEKKLCSAETYTKHDTVGYFHPIQTYYTGTLLDKQFTPTETDHILCFIEYEKLKGKMFSKMQNWALEQFFCKK